MDVARAVEAGLQNPYYALLYFISTCFLAFHLNHGFQSAFQSLGLNNRRYTPLLKKAGTAFAVLIFIGFASFPVLFYFRIVTI